MPQNGQKRRKVQKPKKCTNENWPIFIPCDVDDHFWWSKQAKNTQKQPYLVGLSENRWKNTKNAISQKGLAKRFWKLVKFMSYMCTLRIKSKQTSYRKVRLDMVWGKCELPARLLCILPCFFVFAPLIAFVLKLFPTVRAIIHTSVTAVFFKRYWKIEYVPTTHNVLWTQVVLITWSDHVLTEVWSEHDSWIVCSIFCSVVKHQLTSLRKLLSNVKWETQTLWMWNIWSFVVQLVSVAIHQNKEKVKWGNGHD